MDFPKHFSVPLALAALLLSFPAHADDCDAILTDGIRNTYKELRTDKYKTKFEAAYCMKGESASGKSSGTGLSGSGDGGTLDFSHSKSNTASQRAENCGDNKSAMSDDKFLNALSTVADKNIVAAWESCKTAKFGVVLTGVLNGSTLVLTYKFKSAGSVNSAKVSEEPEIKGATCETPIKVGTVITTGGLKRTCTRNGDEAVSIVLNTDFQPAEFFVPEVQKPEPKAASVICGTPGPQRNECFGRRFLPGQPVGSLGWTWCKIDEKFLNPSWFPYCQTRMSADKEGPCHCEGNPAAAGKWTSDTSITGTLYVPSKFSEPAIYEDTNPPAPAPPPSGPPPLIK